MPSPEPMLKAGTARRVISPPPGIYQIGYGDRSKGNQGVHDDLTATALALDDGQTQVVILACDLLAINEITADRVQDLVHAPLLICCSHSHSAPITYANEHSPRRNRRYMQALVRLLGEAANEALNNCQPARLAWAQGEAGIAINRRQRMPGGQIEIGTNPGGIIDRSLSILQAHSLDGKPIATLVNFCCHGTVLGPRNLLISADWIGAMRREVESATGATALFLQGATGDLNPEHAWGEDDREAVEHLGGQVARAVLQTLPGLTPLAAGRISLATRQVWLPLESRAETAKPPPSYRPRLAGIAHVPAFLVDPILNARYPWKTLVENREGWWSVPLRLGSLRLGELVLSTLGAEVFTGIGLAIKAASPTRHTLVASLCNGCIGYLPSAEEQPLGGYEVDLAPYFYRLPGRLQPGAAEKVLAAFGEMN